MQVMEPQPSSAALAGWLSPLLEDGTLSGGRVLVLGGGLTAEIALLSGRGFQVRVLDASREALSRVPRAANVQTIHADLLAMNPGLPGALDAVVEHGSLGLLEPLRRPDWVFAVARLLPSGGVLAGQFLVGPDTGTAPRAMSESQIRQLLERNFIPGSLVAVGPRSPGRSHLARGVFRRK